MDNDTSKMVLLGVVAVMAVVLAVEGAVVVWLLYRAVDTLNGLRESLDF